MDSKAMIREKVARARASGVRLPVVLLLSQDSPHARAAYLDLHGEPMQGPAHLEPGGEEYGRLEVVPSMTAAGLLRRNASKGGSCAAAQIEDEALPVDWWLVCMTAEHLSYTAFTEEEQVFHGIVSYDNPSREAMKSVGERLQEEGPSMMNLGTAGGETVQVFGRDGAKRRSRRGSGFCGVQTPDDPAAQWPTPSRCVLTTTSSARSCWACMGSSRTSSPRR